MAIDVDAVIEELKRQIDEEVGVDLATPEEAWQVYSSIAGHCETAADALSEENAPESEEWS